MKLLFLMLSICLFSESMTCLLSNTSYGHQRTFEDIEREIANYSDVAEKIIKLAVYGKAQNRSYERLALFVDTFGPRLSGSRNLELAIQYMENSFKKDDLENVHLEPVKIPHWERGEESAIMVEPYNHTIAMLGLGGSVATPPEGNDCLIFNCCYPYYYFLFGIWPIFYLIVLNLSSFMLVREL